MKKWTLLLLPAFAILTLAACKKDKETTTEPTPAPSTTSGTVNLDLNHLWEGSAFSPSEENLYINSATADSFYFTTFKYYVSNVILKKADGSFYVQPDSYFLLNLENPASSMITLSNVPAGNYTDVYFTFGVDSTKNVSGAQAGALDPANGMFWSWSTGYIMSKAEGISPNSPNGSFAFHLGGFHGPNSVVNEKQISLLPAGSLNLTASATKNIHVDIAIEKMWLGNPSLSMLYDMQNPGLTAKTMAYNFTAGMTLNSID